VRDIIRETVEELLQNEQYNHAKVESWGSMIVEKCLQKLGALAKPFKFIANCTVLQKRGQGMAFSASCLWDSNRDGNYTHRFENKTIICITTVFGIAYQY